MKQRSLSWYAIAYAGTGIAQKGFGFLLALWLARSLSKDEYASFGLLFALQSGMSAFAIAGIAEVVISFLSTHQGAEARARLFRSANTVFVALALVLVAISTIVYATNLRQTGTSWLEFACVVAGGVLAAQFLLQSNFVRLEEKHTAAIIFGFCAPMAGLAGAAAAFAYDPKAESYFLGFAGASVLVSIAVRSTGTGHFGLSRKRADVEPIRAAIAPYMGVAAIGWLSGYGNVWVVEAMFPARFVAEFTFAYTLSAILQLAANAMNQVWSPRFFNIVNTTPAAEIDRQNLRFYRFQGMALGAVSAVILLVLPYALKALGGNLSQYDIVDGLAWLFAGYVVTIPWWHAQNYFLVHGEGARLMRIVVYTAVAGMLAWFGAMFVFGSAGIFLGFFFLMLSRSAGIWFAARRMWNIGLAWQGPAIACVLIALAVLAGK